MFEAIDHGGPIVQVLVLRFEPYIVEFCIPNLVLTF